VRKPIDTVLTPEEREHRDETSASMAMHMAHDDGKTAGIVVDNPEKLEVMLERVIRILGEHKFLYDVKRRGEGLVDVHTGKGIVRIAAGSHIDMNTGRMK
jgi:tRNA pseudouridine-54 N-methylase